MQRGRVLDVFPSTLWVGGGRRYSVLAHDGSRFVVWSFGPAVADQLRDLDSAGSWAATAPHLARLLAGLESDPDFPKRPWFQEVAASVVEGAPFLKLRVGVEESTPRITVVEENPLSQMTHRVLRALRLHPKVLAEVTGVLTGERTWRQPLPAAVPDAVSEADVLAKARLDAEFTLSLLQKLGEVRIARPWEGEGEGETYVRRRHGGAPVTRIRLIYSMDEVGCPYNLCIEGFEGRTVAVPDEMLWAWWPDRTQMPPELQALLDAAKADADKYLRDQGWLLLS